MPERVGQPRSFGEQSKGGAVDNDLLQFMPFIITALVVAHLLAFAYWIYRVAVEKQPERQKRS